MPAALEPNLIGLSLPGSGPPTKPLEEREFDDQAAILNALDYAATVWEFFAEIKASIERKWPIYQDEPDHDFGAFLERCVDTFGAEKQSSRGHFRHAGIMIEETPLESTEL
jgi:hypothetical protein